MKACMVTHVSMYITLNCKHAIMKSFLKNYRTLKFFDTENMIIEMNMI